MGWRKSRPFTLRLICISWKTFNGASNRSRELPRKSLPMSTPIVIHQPILIRQWDRPAGTWQIPHVRWARKPGLRLWPVPTPRLRRRRMCWMERDRFTRFAALPGTMPLRIWPGDSVISTTPRLPRSDFVRAING